MSNPTPGNYVIHNRVLSPSGDKLAVTFSGRGIALTTTPLSFSDQQKWIIADVKSGTTQSITPLSTPSLQVNQDKDVVTPLPGKFEWSIKPGDGGYTIKDEKLTITWGLDRASSNVNVTVEADKNRENERWILVPF